MGRLRPERGRPCSGPHSEWIRLLPALGAEGAMGRQRGSVVLGARRVAVGNSVIGSNKCFHSFSQAEGRSAGSRSGYQRWLPGGEQRGNDWELTARNRTRREIQVESTEPQRPRYVGACGPCRDLRTSRKGRTGEDCERGVGGQPRQSGLAGWRFLSALNATVKN